MYLVDTTLKWMLESTMKWMLESTLIKVENFNQGEVRIQADSRGVISIFLQKCYIGGRGGYNSWGDDAYHVDILGPTKPQGHTIMF